MKFKKPPLKNHWVMLNFFHSLLLHQELLHCLALDAFIPQTYRISLQQPLQEDLYCLELYASYLHSLAAVAATIRLVVLSGTLCRIHSGLWCCHRTSGQLCSMGHYAFYAASLQSLAAAAATVVFVVQFGTLCFFASYLQSLAAAAATVVVVVQYGTLCFSCFILTTLLCCRRFNSICCVVWDIMHFMFHTYRASLLPPLQY